MSVFPSTFNAQYYISRYIIPSLSKIINEQNIEDEIDFKTMAHMMKDLCVHKEYGIYLHEWMKPFYQMYFYADKQLWAMWNVAELIGEIADCDKSFPDWAREQNIMKMTACWSEYIQTEEYTHAYWKVLKNLLYANYQAEWKEIGFDLADNLLNEEVYGNYLSSEVYAILHGLSMICATYLSAEEKQEMFSLMHRKWSFMKHLYSVAFRHVIGSKFKNMIQVVNQIHGHPGHHPYAHLIYDILTDRADDFCKKKGDAKKLENHLSKITDVMMSTPPSNELDELSRILFPEELHRHLEANRPMNYQQLKSELDTLKNEMAVQREQMNEQISQMASQLKKMAEASVPISDIEMELMRLPDGMAWEVFGKLNNLLMANEAWARNAVIIRNRILERMQNPQPNVQTTNYYAPGSTHNDGSKHISLTNDKKQIGQA